MEIKEKENVLPPEEIGYAILFRSDYADADAYFADVFRHIQVIFEQYRDDYKIVRQGKELSVSSHRRFGGMFTLTGVSVNPDSGELTLNYRFLIPEPEDRLPLLRHILDHRKDALQSVKFTVTETGFCRILASHSLEITNAFSEAVFLGLLLRMEAALFLYCRRKHPEPVAPEQLPTYFAQVMSMDPEDTVFRQNRHLIIRMLLEESRPDSEDSSPYQEEPEELEKILKKVKRRSKRRVSHITGG